MRSLTATQRIASRFIPEGSREERFEDVDAVVYLSERAGRACALGYVGKAGRAAFHHTFSGGEAHRARFVAEWIARLRVSAKGKADRLAERKAAVHTLAVGDIVVSSWGYDQTNVDFYQVVRVVSSRSVGIRPIDSTLQEDGDLAMTGARTAVRDDFRGEEVVRRAEGKRVNNVYRCHGASLWDGRAMRCSWYA